MNSPSNAIHSPLPLTPRKSDNRPVYEPPIFDYTWATDLEDYEKQREALLAHYNNDVVKVTTFMDLHTEWRLLEQHRYWAYEEASMAANDLDEEKVAFFDTLEEEIKLDRTVVFREFWTLGIRLVMEEGVWVVKGNDKRKKDKYEDVQRGAGIEDDGRRSSNSDLSPSKVMSGLDGNHAPWSSSHAIIIQPQPQPQPQPQSSPLTAETAPLLSKGSDPAHSKYRSLPTITCGCLCS